MLKIRAKKSSIEHSLMLQGKYPHKAYVDKLLTEIDTKLSLLDYKRVVKGTLFNTDKFAEDINTVYKDLCILFELVEEMAVQKYTELEAFTNGFLLALESEADKADLKAREELEATTLNADIVFFSDASTFAFNNEVAVYDMGTLEFAPQSKALGTVSGSGFEIEDVVFEIDGKRISDYNLSGETVKLGGKIDKNFYTYELPEESRSVSSFKLATQDLIADESYHYDIYGDKGFIEVQRNGEMEKHEQLVFDQSFYATANTRYTFYLHNATYIDFDFTVEPSYKSFTSYNNSGLQRDEFTKYEFTVRAGSMFSISSDGEVYATKEEPAVNDSELYIANTTISKSFYIIESIPGPALSLPVKLYIYNADESNLNIKSVAVKEVSDIAGGVIS